MGGIFCPNRFYNKLSAMLSMESLFGFISGSRITIVLVIIFICETTNVICKAIRYALFRVKHQHMPL